MKYTWEANLSRPKRENEDPHRQAEIVPANIAAQHPPLIIHAPLRDEIDFVAPSRHFQPAPMFGDIPGVAMGTMAAPGVQGIQGAQGTRGAQGIWGGAQVQHSEGSTRSNPLGQPRSSIWVSSSSKAFTFWCNFANHMGDHRTRHPCPSTPIFKLNNSINHRVVWTTTLLHQSSIPMHSTVSQLFLNLRLVWLTTLLNLFSMSMRSTVFQRFPSHRPVRLRVLLPPFSIPSLPTVLQPLFIHRLICLTDLLPPFSMPMFPTIPEPSRPFRKYAQRSSTTVLSPTDSPSPPPSQVRVTLRARIHRSRTRTLRSDPVR
jgi:hypothetical protein